MTGFFYVNGGSTKLFSISQNVSFKLVKIAHTCIKVLLRISLFHLMYNMYINMLGSRSEQKRARRNRRDKSVKKFLQESSTQTMPILLNCDEIRVSVTPYSESFGQSSSLTKKVWQAGLLLLLLVVGVIGGILVMESTPSNSGVKGGKCLWWLIFC